MGLLEKLKTSAYHSIDLEEAGKECGCEDHDHSAPLECECCDPCMEYHCNLTMRNSIDSTQSFEQLKTLFEDDPAEWESILETFVEGECKNEELV